MNINNISIKRLRAKGVDPAIILDLILEDVQDPGTPETPMNEKPENTPEDKKPEDKKPEEKKPETPDPKNDIQDQILKAIEKLTGAVQTSNLLNAGSDGPDVDKTEDILASIINPTGGK